MHNEMNPWLPENLFQNVNVYKMYFDNEVNLKFWPTQHINQSTFFYYEQKNDVEKIAHTLKLDEKRQKIPSW